MAGTSDPEAPARYQRQQLEQLRQAQQRARVRLLALAVAAVAALLLAACGVGGFATSQGFSGLLPLQGRLHGLHTRAVVVTHQPPLAPDGLQVTVGGGQTIAQDTWTNQADLRLTAALRSPE